MFSKAITIVYRKRRYHCNSCGKRFYENSTFVPRYHRITNRLIACIIDMLRSGRSFTSVAQKQEIFSKILHIVQKAAAPSDTVQLPKLFLFIVYNQPEHRMSGIKYK